jgi:pimeloyl-ACP methyl ester carboxylesterase
MHTTPFSARTPHSSAQSTALPRAKSAFYLGLSVAGLVLLTGCVSLPKEAPPAKVACPEGVPAGTQCLRGQDSAGSHYLIATPAKWSGVLVVHAHGGPALGEPKASRADEDIKRWAITLSEGHAWAGSVFRQGGFAVTTAAEDTERVRRIFVDHVAKPQRTLLHGQSWGAMVATRAAELYPKSWEGILLTSGVVAGPTTYDFRLDLRAIYQHLCQNHPRPDEPQYPLSLGLPADSKMTAADLATRVNDCLGVRKPAAQRSPEQARKIKTIVDVLKIPENSIVGHLNWGTFTLQDVVIKNGGASPFGNDTVRYIGSDNDAALNAAVLRFKADPQASAKFDADVNHKGRFKVPVLTTHGIGDSTVFVEGSDTLRQRMEASGNGARLVQTYVNSAEHSYLGDAIYPPLFEALLAWVTQGTKPTPAGIAARCVALRPAQAAECRFDTAFTPRPLATRIAPR